MVELSLGLAFGFLLVLLRTTGLFLTIPIISSSLISIRLRLGMAVMFSVAVFSGNGMQQILPPPSLWKLLGWGLAETAIGLAAGLSARLLIEAVQAAGQISGLCSGLGYGALIDPFNGASSSAVGQLMSTMAIALAVALEMPGEAVVWLCRSVVVHPPDGNIDFLRILETILTSSIWSCTLAVRLSFPFMAAAILAHATLGVLNRAIPQLNITNVGFSISLLAGGVTLYWAAPSVAEIAAKAALSIFSRS